MRLRALEHQQVHKIFVEFMLPLRLQQPADSSPSRLSLCIWMSWKVIVYVVGLCG
jgi:hypothetical protein